MQRAMHREEGCEVTKKSADMGMVPAMKKTSRSLLLASLSLALVPAAASAQGTNTSTLYAPNVGVDTSPRTFQTNEGGWVFDTETDPLCLIPGVLICPAPSNSFQATGGAGGPTDGYLRSSFGGVVAVGAASAEAILQSPDFVYNGDAGQVPDQVTVRLTRRSTAPTAISVPEEQEASYDFDLVRVVAGAETDPVSLVNDGPLPGPREFTQQNAIPVDPDDLQMGGTYRLKVTTRYTAIAGVVPAITADYDDIIMRATSIVGTPGPQGPAGTPGSSGPRGPEGDRGPRGGSGRDGRDGRSGRNGLSPEDRRLRRLLRRVAPKKARIIGDNRSVKVKLTCPKQLDDACKMNIQGDLNADGRRLTKSRKVRINDGDSKTVTLPFVNNRRDDLGNRKRMNISQRVKAEDARAEITTRVRLKR